MLMPRRPYVTTRTHEVFALAHDLADQLGHDDVTPVHIALGLVRKGPNVAIGALFNRGVPLDALERDLEARLPPSGTPRAPARERSWTPSVQPHEVQPMKAFLQEHGLAVPRFVPLVRARMTDINGEASGWYGRARLLAGSGTCRGA